MRQKKDEKNQSRIILVPIGGLANRMRAIASGWSLAKAVKKQFIVVWHKNFELNASFNKLFKDDLPFNIIEPNDFIYNCCYEFPRKKNLFISHILKNLKGISNYLYISYEYEPDQLCDIIKKAKGDIVIHSGLQFYDFDPKILVELFRFSDMVISTERLILKDYQPQYAIQIRRTDNKMSINNSPLELFERIIVTNIEKSPQSKFFLATDDKNIKKYFFQKYPLNIIYNPNNVTRNTLEGMIDAAAEFCIMAECPIIYGSYWSSFSEIAALYGNTRLIVVSKDILDI